MSSNTVINPSQNKAYRAMFGVEQALSTCSIEKPLRELIKLRVSQINGCAFCIDMHWKDARSDGESEKRLYSLPAWRDSTYYSDRERAGLQFAEELTRVADRPLPEAVYESVRNHFNDEELGDLAWVIAAINAWNRVNVALRNAGGDYQPATSAN